MSLDLNNVYNFFENEDIKVDKESLKEIFNKKILIVGCGGVGSNLLVNLVKTGFSNFKIIDFDIVEKNNLSRQYFFENQIGKFKTNEIKKNILKINSKLKIENLNIKFNKTLKEDFFENIELIVDCSDNFESRKIINYFSKKYKINWIYLSAIKSSCMGKVFHFDENNFEKFFKDVKDFSCSKEGILLSSLNIICSIGTILAIKTLSNIKENNLIKIDIWKNKFWNLEL